MDILIQILIFSHDTFYSQHMVIASSCQKIVISSFVTVWPFIQRWLLKLEHHNMTLKRNQHRSIAAACDCATHRIHSKKPMRSSARWLGAEQILQSLLLSNCHHLFFYQTTWTVHSSPSSTLPIGLVGWVFANGPVDLRSIPARVILKTLKMVLNITNHICCWP